MSLANKILAIIFFIVAPFSTYTGYAKINSDSLTNVLSRYKTPQDKISFLNNEAKDIYISDSNSAFVYLKKAITIGLQNNLYSNLGSTYNIIGNIYNHNGIGSKTKENYNSSYEYYMLSNDSLGLSKITNNLGIYYFQWPNDYTKSLLFLERSLELKKILKSGNKPLGNIYFNLGTVHLLLNNYVKSLEFFFKGLSVFEAIDDKSNVANTINRISQVYVEIGDLNKARKYLNQSRAISKNIEDERILAYNNLLFSTLYINLNIIDSALISVSQAELVFMEKNEKLGLGRVYNNYIDIYTTLEQFDKVFVYSNLAKDIFIESGSILDLSFTYNKIGVAYYKTKQNSMSRVYLNKSQAISVKHGFIDITLRNFQYLAELDYQEKRYKEAYRNFINYSDTKDSIFSIKKVKIASDIEDKYAINKKEVEIQLLAQEKLKVEIERDQNRATSNYLMLIIILVLIVLSLIFYLYYSNRRLNDTLEELVQERTKELKKTNRLLTNSKKNEEDVSRIKSDLLKNISESLKTPISEIQDLVDILKGENEDNDNIYEQLELITSSTHRLNSIIKSITEIYSVEVKRNTKIDKKFPLFQLIQGVINNYKALALARGLVINLESVKESLFTNNSDLIANAIDHLLKTVVDYASSGDIFVKLYQKKDSKVIEVCSSNFNINKKVFNNDLSTNVDSNIHKIDRMFINLYVTKKMICKMGGIIHWESSNSGEGIRFIMSYPNEED